MINVHEFEPEPKREKVTLRITKEALLSLGEPGLFQAKQASIRILQGNKYTFDSQPKVPNIIITYSVAGYNLTIYYEGDLGKYDLIIDSSVNELYYVTIRASTYSEGKIIANVIDKLVYQSGNAKIISKIINSVLLDNYVDGRNILCPNIDVIQSSMQRPIFTKEDARAAYISWEKQEKASSLYLGLFLTLHEKSEIKQHLNIK